MPRTYALVAAVALLVLSGAVAGVWTNRWGLSMSTEEARRRLEAVPLDLDGWEAHELALSDAEQRQAEIAGYAYRRYVNRKSGAVVTALILCGRPGPMSVHPPEVCFRGAGWQEQGGRSTFPLPGGPFEFKVLNMRKASPTAPGQLRLYMALGGKGGWSVPSNPRLTFAGQGALYKIYVTHESPDLKEPADKGPPVELLGALMPRLQEGLFPAG